jgi:hypothetical protein
MLRKHPRRRIHRNKVVHRAARRRRLVHPELDSAPPTADNRGYDTYSLIFGYDLSHGSVDR